MVSCRPTSPYTINIRSLNELINKQQHKMSTNNSHEQAKCQRAKQILCDDWQLKMADTDFKDLIDIDKLKNLGKLDYRNITKIGLFSEKDKAFISEKRRKVNNRRAAKKFRESEKFRQTEMNFTIADLEEQRNVLHLEKQNLLDEIRYFQYLQRYHLFSY